MKNTLHLKLHLKFSIFLQYDTTQTYGNDSKHLLTFIGVLHSLLLLLIGGTERELKWCEEAAGGGGVGCSIVIDEP